LRFWVALLGRTLEFSECGTKVAAHQRRGALCQAGTGACAETRQQDHQAGNDLHDDASIAVGIGKANR
jgi:hypothetical protein